MLTLTLLFTLAVLVVNAVNSTVYYNNNETMPGAVGGTIIALYLGGTFVIGLVTPMGVGAIGPVLAYPAATFLWPLTLGSGYDRLTYDSGWAGAVLYTLVPTAFIWMPSMSAGYWAGHWKRDDRAMNNPTELKRPACKRWALP